MKALRCDRCHGYYNPAEEKDETIVIPRISWRNADSIKDQRITRSLADLDLCPGCTADFGEFMSFQKEEERKDICRPFDEEDDDD